MAIQTTYPAGEQPTVGTLTDTAINTRVGILGRWRQHHAERKRRLLAQLLRRTANRAHDADPIRRRREALLHYRAAAVRTDLLEIAALLERTPTPNPACVATLHELLTNGCDSPLYNPNIDVSELRAALDLARAGLVTQA
jgi:hypothetical protein